MTYNKSAENTMVVWVTTGILVSVAMSALIYYLMARGYMYIRPRKADILAKANIYTIHIPDGAYIYRVYKISHSRTIYGDDHPHVYPSNDMWAINPNIPGHEGLMVKYPYTTSTNNLIIDGLEEKPFHGRYIPEGLGSEFYVTSHMLKVHHIYASRAWVVDASPYKEPYISLYGYPNEVRKELEDSL